MVLENRTVSELVNAPVPVPLEVLLSYMVGLGLVLQHTPRAVTVALPSLLIFPPLVAVVLATVEATVVVSVGVVAVVKLTSVP